MLIRSPLLSSTFSSSKFKDSDDDDDDDSDNGDDGDVGIMELWMMTILRMIIHLIIIYDQIYSKNNRV
jgi:hypothetical protein